jgi:hypothetical protein
MCRKLVYLVCCALLLSLAGSARADLVAYWDLDEGTGSVVHDRSAMAMTARCTVRNGARANTAMLCVSMEPTATWRCPLLTAWRSTAR